MSFQYEYPGFSVYYSQFELQRKSLEALYRPGAKIFTSFHISEESCDSYVVGMEKMCAFLKKIGYEIIGDVSSHTLDVFGETDIVHFARRMNIDVLRFDCGFSLQEIAAVARKMPVCLNASTISEEDAAFISDGAVKVYAMHNFYPRPETGLDGSFFRRKNEALARCGIIPSAFIPGDCSLRGPIFEGLPTLESHRGCSPWASYFDFLVTYGVHSIFVGDGIISLDEMSFIDDFLKDGVVDIPVKFNDKNERLYDMEFTIRPDSPSRLARLTESREYAMAGPAIEKDGCLERKRGVVTIDNVGYKRYSGEIQIIRESLPSDDRVNVIGFIPEKYHLLLDCIANGRKIRFARTASSDER